MEEDDIWTMFGILKREAFPNEVVTPLFTKVPNAARVYSE